ncbi:MAG: hypothetical protein ABS79_05010 [Planctomycetes bacterium SCN 63-9]|nr:MAG: hypothetical protein ABS79_05010 [Planctomycetes bacterium SCN 63-9]
MKPCDSEQVVAVIGGGFSGTMVAVQLARLAGTRRCRVILFEKGNRFARGVAYGTTCEQHLLNVPAGHMSALPDEPSHFLDWLRRHDPDAHAGTFASRQQYGNYLEELLGSTAGTSPVEIELSNDEVVDLVEEPSEGSITLKTARGNSRRADHVVLALGHAPPQDPAGLVRPGHLPGYFANPWNSGGLEGLDPSDPIPLIGTGLTAVDLVIEAEARGHRGPIHAYSRHGILPHRHQAAPSRVHSGHTDIAGMHTPTARSLLKQVRSEARQWQAEGGDWRSVIDGVRPVAQTLWRGLAEPERRRFLRHVAPRWDVHRHRIAPQIDDRIQAAREGGQFEVVAARVLALEVDEATRGIRMRIRPRGASEDESRVYRRVFNCTGPSRDIRAGSSPLLKAIIRRGLGQPGPLALGLDVGDSGALIAPGGRENARILAIGPLLKEKLWETTAIRELRVQAADLARQILS